MVPFPADVSSSTHRIPAVLHTKTSSHSCEKNELCAAQTFALKERLIFLGVRTGVRICRQVER